MGRLDNKSVEIQSHAIPNNTLTSDKLGSGNPKPKGTWTRINRMDFRLAGLTKAITILGLGKMDSHEVQEEQHDE